MRAASRGIGRNPRPVRHCTRVIHGSIHAAHSPFNVERWTLAVEREAHRRRRPNLHARPDIAAPLRGAKRPTFNA
jgi:hypothetical protein